MSNINPIKRDRLEHLLEHYYYGMVADAYNFEEFIGYMPKDLLPLYFRIEGYERLGWAEVIAPSSVVDDDEVQQINTVGKTNSIQTGAFCNCPKLERVTIKTGSTITIAEGAFQNCLSLKQVVIQTMGDYQISESALLNCPNAKIFANVIQNDAASMQNMIGDKELLKDIYVDVTIQDWAKNAIAQCLENLGECLKQIQQIIPSLPIKITKIHFIDDIDCPGPSNMKERIRSMINKTYSLHPNRYDSEDNYIAMEGLNCDESRRFDGLIDRVRRFGLDYQGMRALTLPFVHPDLQTEIIMDPRYKFITWFNNAQIIRRKIRQASTSNYNTSRNLVKEAIGTYTCMETICCDVNPGGSDIEIRVATLCNCINEQPSMKEDFAQLLQLIILRCLIEKAFYDKTESADNKDGDAIKVLARMLSTYVVDAYLAQSNGKYNYVVNKAYSELTCDIQNHPEILGMYLEETFPEKKDELYHLMIERCDHYTTVAYIMISKMYLEHNEQHKTKVEEIQLVEAFKHFHPDLPEEEMSNYLAGVDGKIIAKVYGKGSVLFHEMHENDKTIKAFTIENKVRVVESRSFSGCSNLKKLIIENDDELLIEPYAFADSGLETVRIKGKGKVWVSDYAFCSCRDLTVVFIDERSADVSCFSPKCFYNCWKTNIICTDENGESICEYERKTSSWQRNSMSSNIEPPFYFKEENEYEIIKNDLFNSRTIKPMTFAYNSNLKKVAIDSSPLELCHDAFYKCPQLREIICLSNPKMIEFIDLKAFQTCKNAKLVFKDENNVTLYRMPGWWLEELKDYNSHKEITKPENIRINNEEINQWPHFSWLVFDKWNQRKSAWNEFLNFYFADAEQNTDELRICFDLKKETSKIDWRNIKESTDELLKQCKTSLFHKDRNKEKIEDYLKDFRQKWNIEDTSSTAPWRLLRQLCVADSQGRTTLQQVSDDEELHTALNLFTKTLSRYRFHAQSLFCKYLQEKKELCIYVGEIWPEAMHGGKRDALLFLDELEYAAVYGLAMQKLIRLLDSADCSELKKKAALEGCACAIALDFLYQKEDKKAYENIQQKLSGGVYPYWPYVLNEQLYFQCYENREQMRELLKDIIEKAAKDPNESIRMIDRLCCCEDDESVYDLLG